MGGLMNVVVIGGGPSGLAAAEVLSDAGCDVTVIDRMPTMGRKLLMAGRSGLNLTNVEMGPSLLGRYGAAAEWLAPALAAFSPSDMVHWAEGLGQRCFTGSSGRVFPDAMKASPLLRAWLRRLAEQGVQFRTGLRWTGWNAQGALRFDGPTGEECVTPDVTVLALGGGSWARLGSDGHWTQVLLTRGVSVAPLRPANCGFRVEWSSAFRERFAGTPLKRVTLSFGGEKSRAEAVITERGLEGGGLYALAAPLREAIERDGEVVLRIDLRPDMDVTTVAERLSRVRARESLSNRLRKALPLPPVAVGLLREAGEVPSDTGALAHQIKALPVRLVGTDTLDRAISTAGGVRQEAVDQRFMLRALPGVFVCGEMLDWEAPTGGYLLQAVMATGRAAGKGALAWGREKNRWPEPVA
ncbi:TIGR03862 family flavoprotein [Acetobacter estunensis]